MAKIYKVEMYVVDPNDSTNELNDVIRDLANGSDTFIPVTPTVEVSEFNWDDSLPINKLDCSIEECEKYFTPCSRNENFCVACGESAPEGSQICGQCWEYLINR